jgi:hypothetical protein
VELSSACNGTRNIGKQPPKSVSGTYAPVQPASRTGPAGPPSRPSQAAAGKLTTKTGTEPWQRSSARAGGTPREKIRELMTEAKRRVRAKAAGLVAAGRR